MVAITYRTAGAWGPGKGANLTPAEADTNFYNLDAALQNLIDNPPTPKEITNIVLSGSQLTFYLEGGATFGPYTIPRAPFRPSIVSEITATTYEPTLGASNYYFRCTNVAGCTVTIPANADVAFPIDTEITFRQAAAGAVVIDSPTDVTINGRAGYLDQTALQGDTVTVKKVGTDEWDLIGGLAEEITA